MIVGHMLAVHQAGLAFRFGIGDLDREGLVSAFRRHDQRRRIDGKDHRLATGDRLLGRGRLPGIEVSAGRHGNDDAERARCQPVPVPHWKSSTENHDPWKWSQLFG
jgi:hypothetical protein